MNYCDRQELSDGTQAALDRAFWEKKNEEIASEGQRVLGLAWQKMPKSTKPLSMPLASRRNSSCSAWSALSIRHAMRP